MPLIPPFMNTLSNPNPDTTTTLPSATHPDNPVPAAGVQPPAGPTPNALSNEGVVNFDALKRDRARTEAKYNTHTSTSSDDAQVTGEKKDAGGEDGGGGKVHTEQEKSLLDAAKGAGEALSQSFGSGGKK